MIRRLIILLLIVGCDNSTEPVPEDCAGVAGGTAVLDSCAVCVGGTNLEIQVPDTTSVMACTQDCEGVWGGIAVEDDCGVCGGGDTSGDTDGDGICDTNDLEPNCSTNDTDECGVCDGDATNDCPKDCADVWGGTSWISDCGCVLATNSGDVCDDCAGTPNGTATTDNCGICDADTTNDGTTDNCGVCDNDSSNDCVQDDCGLWGGNNTPLTGTCDCAGTPNGDATTDDCGTCDTDSSNDCVQDCANVWGGTSWISDCGCVSADNSGDECDDCDGTPNGDAVEDNCGTCDTDSSNDCVQDCSGVWGGDSWISDCGCVSVTNSGDDCDDCSGAPNGSALEDNCGNCDNDSSNDCVEDCAGDWGGTDTTCYGCTDSNAINYNSSSTIDDGSCINFNTQIAGCISSLNAGNNVTLQAKAVNNSSVTITISGIMLLNNENQVIFIQGLNTALQPNYYVTYNMNLAYPSSGNAFEYISNGYKILWQFDYDGNTYQNTYEINGTIGGC